MVDIRLSFSRMGWSYIFFKALFHDLPGIEVVEPPIVNTEIVSEGVKNAPEFVCFPFKVILGEMINMYHNHDVKDFIMIVDYGPCRAGMYGVVQKRILKNMGFKDINMFYLRQDDFRNLEWLRAFSDLEEYLGRKFDDYKIFRNTLLFLTKAYYVERVTHIEGLVRCREKNKSMTTKVVHTLMNLLDKENNLLKLANFDKTIDDHFRKIPIDKEMEPLRVCYTGEIQVMLEKWVNYDLMGELGVMGIEVHKQYDVFDWVMYKLDASKRRRRLEDVAKDYIPMDIGGEAVWNMGSYLECQEKGFDGFVHIFPFTCMPEISLMGMLESEKNIDKFYMPHIHFSLDGSSGFEGMRTRIEAFYDLMVANKKSNPVFRDAEYEVPDEIRNIYLEPKSSLEYFKSSIEKPLSKVLTMLKPSKKLDLGFAIKNGLDFFLRNSSFDIRSLLNL
jgi:predicted nucleotide-binding protein (sugar kinase/HSP70/actin superfamily)